MQAPLFNGSRHLDLEDIDKMATKIQGRLCGRIRDFRLMKDSRGLILKGHALELSCQGTAQHAVMETTSEPILANEIEVTPSSQAESVFA